MSVLGFWTGPEEEDVKRGRVGVRAREMRVRCGGKSGSEWKLEWKLG